MLLQGQPCLSSLPFQVPPAPIGSHPVLHLQGNRYIFFLFLNIDQLSTVFALAKAGQGVGEKGQAGWGVEVAASGNWLAAASPQGHSCEAAWGTQSHPFAVQIQEESRLQRLFNILAASFSATCSDRWGTVCSAPTCGFRNKEWSVKVFCRDSPTLQFFPLCNRLFLVCSLASEITSLSALDDFHNIHYDSEFQCSG